jgi:hypothetical protein
VHIAKDVAWTASAIRARHIYNMAHVLTFVREIQQLFIAF